MPCLKAGECHMIGDLAILPLIIQIDECNPEPSPNDISYFHLLKVVRVL